MKLNETGQGQAECHLKRVLCLPRKGTQYYVNRYLPMNAVRHSVAVLFLMNNDEPSVVIQ